MAATRLRSGRDRDEPHRRSLLWKLWILSVAQDRAAAHLALLEPLADLVHLGDGVGFENRLDLAGGAAAKLSRDELSATQRRCRAWLEAFEKRKATK